MRRAWMLGGTLLAGAMMLAHCSSSSTSPTAVDAGPACSTLAAARCQQLQTCNPYSFEATYGADTGACLSAMTGTCIQGLQVSGNTNTPAMTTQCAQDTAAETCESYFLNTPPSSCIAPAGAIDAGSPCGVSGQCGTQLCQTPRTSVCGMCAPQPTAGSACGLYGCGRGLVCDADGGVCIAPAFTAGAACSDPAQCGAGFTCLVTAGTGQCVALATTVGAGCNVRDGGVPCGTLDGLFCDSKGGSTCQKYTWADPGQPCGYLDAGLRVACASGGFCAPSADGGLETCLAPAADGAPCDTALGPSCRAPSKCVWNSADGGTAGICQPPQPSSCVSP